MNITEAVKAMIDKYNQNGDRVEVMELNGTTYKRREQQPGEIAPFALQGVKIKICHTIPHDEIHLFGQKNAQEAENQAESA